MSWVSTLIKKVGGVVGSAVGLGSGSNKPVQITVQGPTAAPAPAPAPLYYGAPSGGGAGSGGLSLDNPMVLYGLLAVVLLFLLKR